MKTNSIEQKLNPSVLNVVVTFRSANGKFSKPHLARYIDFVLPGTRKRVVVDFPPGRRSTKDSIDFAREAVFFFQREREEELAKKRKPKRIDEKELIPAAPRRKKPTAPRKIRVDREKKTLFSKGLNSYIQIIGYDFIFGSKVEVDESNFDNFLKMLRPLLIKKATEVFKKEKMRGKMMYIKIYGDGKYMRRAKAGKKERVPDTLGFSLGRFQLFSIKEVQMQIDDILKEMREAFMPKRSRGRVDGYFAWMFQGNKLYIPGFRIECTTVIEELPLVR